MAESRALSGSRFCARVEAQLPNIALATDQVLSVALATRLSRSQFCARNEAQMIAITLATRLSRSPLRLRRGSADRHCTREEHLLELVELDVAALHRRLQKVRWGLK